MLRRLIRDMNRNILGQLIEYGFDAVVKNREKEDGNAGSKECNEQ